MGCGLRHLHLLVGFLVLLLLFSSIALVHLTALLDPSSPRLILPFASLASRFPPSEEDGRFKREISPWGNASKWDDGHPVVRDEEGKAPLPLPTSPTAPPSTPRTTFVFSNPPSSTTARTTTTTTTEESTTVKEDEEEEEDEVAVAKEIMDKILARGGGDSTKAPEAASAPSTALDTVLRTVFYSSAGLGMFLTLPLVPFLSSIGPHFLAGGALLFSAAVTAWQPFMSFYGACICRLLQGASFSLALPLVQCLIVDWSPMGDRPFFASFLLLFFPLSSATFWPLTQLFFDLSLPRWLPHCLLAVLSVLVALVTLFLFKAHPHDHSSISGVELNKIRAGKGKESSQQRRALDNIRPQSFWSVFSSFSAFFLILSSISMYLPSLLCSVDVMYGWNLGVTASTPFFGFALLFLLCSFLPFSILSTRILNSLALGLSALLVVALPLVIDPDNCVWLLPCLLLPLGLFSGGSVHLGVVYPSMRTIPSIFLPLALAMAVAPVIVEALVHLNLLREWFPLFLVVGVTVAALAVPYPFFARPVLFPSFKQTTLAVVDDDEECGLRELHLLPPAGKYLE